MVVAKLQQRMAQIDALANGTGPISPQQDFSSGVSDDRQQLRQAEPWQRSSTDPRQVAREQQPSYPQYQPQQHQAQDPRYQYQQREQYQPQPQQSRYQQDPRYQYDSSSSSRPGDAEIRRHTPPRTTGAMRPHRPMTAPQRRPEVTELLADWLSSACLLTGQYHRAALCQQKTELGLVWMLRTSRWHRHDLFEACRQLVTCQGATSGDWAETHVRVAAMTPTNIRMVPPRVQAPHQLACLSSWVAVKRTRMNFCE